METRFGDRAGFVDPGAKWKLDPANYGDVSPLVCKVRSALQPATRPCDCAQGILHKVRWLVLITN